MAKRSKPFPILPVAIAGGVIVAGALAYVITTANTAQKVAEAAQWTAAGEPCLTLTKAEFDAQNIALTYSFDYQGMTVARAFGQAECTDIHDDGGKGGATHSVCVFTAPGVVKATVDGQDHYFQAKFAKPVTLAYEDGKFSCVLAKPAGAEI
jgi:hypothetical protein